MTDFETSISLTMHAMECPFCGNMEPQLVNLETKYWIISCTACGAHGPSGNTSEQALEHWNWNGYVAE